jgi:hypothetical protein
LLTTGEISHQYVRYNQSETMDAATQAVFAAILDTIEAAAPTLTADSGTPN